MKAKANTLSQYLLQQALTLYQTVLKLQPTQFDALHFKRLNGVFIIFIFIVLWQSIQN